MAEKKHLLKRHSLLPFVIFFLVMFLISFAVGKYPISPIDLVKILFSRIFPIAKTWSREAETIVFNIRLPRIILASFIGAALSLSGLVYQGIFQNPLVSPDVLGTSSASGFGAALALFFGFSYVGITLTSFAFGMLSVVLVLTIGRKINANKILSFVLSGIMISSLFSSSTSFLKLVADTDQVLPAITYYLMGSLTSTRTSDLPFAITLITISIIPLFFLRWPLNVLTQGEDEARSMGVNTDLIRKIAIVLATIMTSATVAVAGVIGWIGLVVPHLVRMMLGCDYRKTLPSAIFLGAGFLVMVDTVSRILTTYEIPIGILTSFIGAPFFLYLLLREGKKT
jgi:ABC-type Fe3+-siderophore transport system, permease component